MERVPCSRKPQAIHHRLLHHVLATILWNKLYVGLFCSLLCTKDILELELLIGQNSGYYAPQIFQTVGVSKTNASLFATGIYGTVKVITTGIFLLTGIDYLGRR